MKSGFSKELPQNCQQKLVSVLDRKNYQNNTYNNNTVKYILLSFSTV